MDLQNLDHPVRVSFWLNVYHTLCLHAYVLCESEMSTGTAFAKEPSNLVDNLKIHKAAKYDVGGVGIFSAAEIHFGILKTKGSSENPGGNRSGGFLTTKIIPLDESRLATLVGELPHNPMISIVTLTNSVPKIFMGINLGTRSSPRIRVYQPLTVFDELEKASRTYTREYMFIDTRDKKVIIPELLEWNSASLGGTKNISKEFVQYLLKDEKKNYNERWPVEELAHDQKFAVVFQYGKSTFMSPEMS